MFILPILDEELFKEILQYFYEDHLQDGEKLQLAININDIKTAKNITHTLKGVASSIGAMTLYEHAKALDFSINEQQTDQYQALFSTLKDELDKVIASINLNIKN